MWTLKSELKTKYAPSPSSPQTKQNNSPLLCCWMIIQIMTLGNKPQNPPFPLQKILLLCKLPVFPVIQWLIVLEWISQYDFIHITWQVRQTKEQDLELTPPPAVSSGVKDVVTSLLSYSTQPSSGLKWHLPEVSLKPACFPTALASTSKRLSPIRFYATSPISKWLRDGKMLLIILRAGSSSYSGTFSIQYGGEQGRGRRFLSFTSEYIYIILGNKGTSKSTKKITNLFFLENSFENFSTGVLPRLVFPKLFKFTQFHSI